MTNSKVVESGIHDVLEKKATSYLKTDFKLKEYRENPSPHWPDQYLVVGQVMRYGEPVTVEVMVEKKDLKPWYWKILDANITLQTEHIGQIQLGKKVCVTDPCYTRDVWCMTTLDDVKPGTWDVHACIDAIDAWGKRTYVLELCHQDFTEQAIGARWVEVGELGVDSGQMSVFDDAHYRRKNGSEEEFEKDIALENYFYNKCCDLSEDLAGIYYDEDKPVGAVCASGCGDGVYPLSVKKINGEIVAMNINFM